MMQVFRENVGKSRYFRKKFLSEMFDWVLKTPLGIVGAAFLARYFCKGYIVNDGLTALGAFLKTKTFGWALVGIGRFIRLRRYLKK